MDKIMIPDKKKQHRKSKLMISGKFEDPKKKKAKLPKKKRIHRYFRGYTRCWEWNYHAHPKVDDRNPFSKSYSRLRYDNNINIHEKYRSFPLRDLPKPDEDLFGNTEVIKTEEPLKYYVKKTLYSFKRKSNYTQFIRNGNTVENELICIYFNNIV
jgi:hypothetical protein